MYYDFSKIDSYNAPVNIIVSRRGLGKTFGIKKRCLEKFITKGKRFIYIVGTDTARQELTTNNGERFWADILKYYGKQDTSRKRYIYKHLVNLEVEEGDLKFNSRKGNAIVGGTIKVAGDVAGYVLDLNSFEDIKRNSFVDIDCIILDEFISEKMDKTVLTNPKKFSSIVQSVARLQQIKIYMLGNTVRIDDPILSRMGFKIERYGYYLKKDNYGLIAVLHFVNPSEYPEFADEFEKSVAGRLARMLKETNEEENKFLTDLPKERRLTMFNYKKGGMNINVVRGDIIVSIRELKNGGFAVVPFANTRCSMLFCLSEKEQGYKLGFQIVCNKELKQMLMNMIRADLFYYYSDVEYNQLKLIIKGD